MRHRWLALEGLGRDGCQTCGLQRSKMSGGYTWHLYRPWLPAGNPQRQEYLVSHISPMPPCPDNKGREVAKV